METNAVQIIYDFANATGQPVPLCVIEAILWMDLRLAYAEALATEAAQAEEDRAYFDWLPEAA